LLTSTLLNRFAWLLRIPVMPGWVSLSCFSHPQRSPLMVPTCWPPSGQPSHTIGRPPRCPHPSCCCWREPVNI
jgi:hypothetical protein